MSMMAVILGGIWAGIFVAKLISATGASTVAGESVENVTLFATGMDDFRNQQFMNDMNNLQELQNQQFMNDMNFMQDLQNRQFMNDMNTFSMNSVTPFEMGGFDMEQGNSFNLFDNMSNNCGSGFGDFGCGGMF